MKIILIIAFIFSAHCCFAQDTNVVYEGAKMVLPEIFIRNNNDYKSILNQIKNDTTFYKAFRNLHVVEYSSYNNILMKDKHENNEATYYSKTRQHRANGCRTTEVQELKTTGDFFNADSSYNYLTAEMYASLFFAKGKVCGEDNIVAGHEFNPDNKSGMEKHKEQLKMLFFNPGKKIPGIPFIGNKLDLYDEDAAKLYDYKLEYVDYKGITAYKFTITKKPDLGFFKKGDVVVDEMTTWFDPKNMEVLARNYSLSYGAAVYDFDVDMEVEMTHVGNLLVPQTLRYKGNFAVIFKKRERGEFTATLFDFKQ
jgi:hypothetical protein